MPPRPRKRNRWLFSLAFAIPTALALCALLTIGFAVRQESLDRALVAAIEQNETARALALLDAGANPNARKSVTPPRSLLQIIKDLLHCKRPLPVSKDSPSALALAVKQDNVDVARALLAHHATGVNESVDAPYFYSDTRHWPLLLTAIHHGSCSMAVLLLDHGADIKAGDGDYGFPLATAVDPLADKDPYLNPVQWRQASERVRRMVEMLLDRGADPGFLTSEGYDVLDLAARYNDNTVVDYLLARGLSPNEGKGKHAALTFAVEYGNMEMVRSLLHHGAHIRPGETGLDPLTLVARDFPTLRFVLARGADVNAIGVSRKREGWTRLAQAAYEVNEAEVRFLLAQGADANAGGPYGYTPLMAAAREANPRIIELLLAHGAHVNGHNEDGITPLMMAVWAQGDQNVQCLLRYGADPDCKDIHGRTALMLAIESDAKPVAQDLLRVGAKINLSDKNGRTALDYAEGPHLSLVALLQRWGGRSGQRLPPGRVARGRSSQL